VEVDSLQLGHRPTVRSTSNTSASGLSVTVVSVSVTVIRARCTPG